MVIWLLNNKCQEIESQLLRMIIMVITLSYSNRDARLDQKQTEIDYNEGQMFS